MNILVLGGAGYIGTTLVPKLREKKHRVTVLDWGAFRDGAEFIKSLPGVIYAEADVRDVGIDEFVGMDAVIDLAAISNDPSGELDTALTWQVNRDARARNAGLAESAGVKRYILASSASVYGVTTYPKIDADETSPLRPQSTYAQAAIAAEEAVLAQGSQNMSVTVLRQATVYGLSPRMRWDLVLNAFVRDLWRSGQVTVQGSGEQFRPLVYVGDTAGAMIDVLTADQDLVKNQIFNIVGENIQIYRLAEDLAEHFGGKVNYVGRGADTRSYRMSGEKYETVLNRFCRRNYLWHTEEEIWNALEEAKVDPDLPTTVEVYRKKFGPKLSDLSARIFQT